MAHIGLLCLMPMYRLRDLDRVYILRYRVGTDGVCGCSGHVSVQRTPVKSALEGVTLVRTEYSFFLT